MSKNDFDLACEYLLNSEHWAGDLFSNFESTNSSSNPASSVDSRIRSGSEGELVWPSLPEFDSLDEFTA